MKQFQILILLSAFLLSGCSYLNSFMGSSSQQKIEFQLDQLDTDGLYGPEDGKRSVSYEFCIPGVVEYAQQVMSIDQTAIIYKDSPGRIQCKKYEYLVIGETSQPDFKTTLHNLATLDYVTRIVEAHFE
ncbi:hypothetical protein [uncultured Endozoicomonas sp.]|uniref:hypothetical protein n=1 Tax=uncultured Endozoicomonas sp. TaxID=432652 RepID=UPI002621C646|nr:hypothetical protein [uncultured Endozoicomonas sp.]